MTTGPDSTPRRRQARLARSAAGWSEGEPAAEVEGGDALAIDADHRYRDVELAGAGGMGTVMMAYDRRLGRDIAIKRVAALGDDAGAHRRLAREARITARLEHPGIVPIHDAGIGPDGRSYYAMRLIRGRSLALVLDGAPTPGERLPLVRSFLAVCQAIAYAHRHGVAHLDLKPTNIMIGEFGETLVVDWGLARELDGAASPAPLDDAGAPPRPAAGTPAYLGPERARGEAGDAATDVWALGAILVELLTGARLIDGTADAALRLLAGPPPPPRGWPERCPPELCAIADKALAWDRRDRYPDGEALSRDVAAYLDGRRVAAHDYSTIELARRLVHAWRWQLAAVAAALIAAIAVLALSRSRIERQRARAVAADARSRESLAETKAALTRALDQSAIAALAAGDNAAAEAYATAALAHGESTDARGVLAATRAGSRPASAVRHDLGGCLDVIPDDDRHALCHTRDALELWELPADQPRWRRPMRIASAVGLHGRWVIALDSDEAAVILDGATGAVRRSLPMAKTFTQLVRGPTRAVVHNRHRITELAPDRADADAVRDLGAACGVLVSLDAVAVGATDTYAVCNDGRVQRIGGDGATATVAQLAAISPDRPASVAALDREERTLAVGTIGGEVALVDLAAGKVGAPVRVLDERVASLALTTSGVAVAGERGGARVWRRALDGEIVRLPERAGRQLAVAGDDLITGGTAWWRWSLTPAPAPRRFAAPAGLSSAAISPDGRLLAAARGDGHVSVWATASGDRVADVALAPSVVKRLDFDATGARLAAGLAGAPSVIVLDTAGWRPQALGASTEGTHRLAYLGDQLVAAHYSGALDRWRDGQAADRVPADGFVDAERTAGRDALWLLSATGVIVRYRGAALEPLLRVPNAGWVAPTADGRRVVVGLLDDVEVHDVALGSVASLVGSGARLTDVAVSPDDRWVAAATVAGTIDVWSLADRRWVAHLRGHQQRVAWVGFAAGALWSASWDGVVLRWDLTALAATPTALAADAAATWALP